MADMIIMNDASAEMSRNRTRVFKIIFYLRHYNAFMILRNLRSLFLFQKQRRFQYEVHRFVCLF